MRGAPPHAMCCFSRSVEFVSDTQIFARMLGGGRQVLVYSMSVGAPEALAMILPIPVLQPAADDAVKFIDLSGYSRFFVDLASVFLRPPSPKLPAAALADSRSRLKVEKVGSFEASFVPAIKDFSRLDPRFRLPEGVWEKLGAYRDYGFAVFRLAQGKAKIHPMAFSFPTSRPGELFFPTVHIHDGTVHPRADFDHVLYCQAPPGLRSLLEWGESPDPAAHFARIGAAKNVLDGAQHVRRRLLAGPLPNQDTWLRVT